MFHPKPHCKCLGLHGNPFLIKHGKGVPGAVPDGENKLPAPKPLLPVYHNAGNFSVPHLNICHKTSKPHFTSQPYNLIPQIPHYLPQYIRSDVWFCLITNAFFCAKPHQGFQYYPVSAITVLHQGIQLSVGKSTGSALAELYVGLGI